MGYLGPTSRIPSDTLIRTLRAVTTAVLAVRVAGIARAAYGTPRSTQRHAGHHEEIQTYRDRPYRGEAPKRSAGRER